MNRISAALTAVCGVASLVFMMMVGRHQKSVLLVVMFTLWVSAPFAALIAGLLSSRAWLERKRGALSVTAVILSLASASVYAAVAFGPPRPQPAAFFLLVPAASWPVILIFVLIASMAKHE